MSSSNWVSFEPAPTAGAVQGVGVVARLVAATTAISGRRQSRLALLHDTLHLDGNYGDRYEDDRMAREHKEVCN